MKFRGLQFAGNSQDFQIFLDILRMRAELTDHRITLAEFIDSVGVNWR